MVAYLKPRERDCKVCGEEYMADSPQSTTCSKECRNAYVNDYMKERRKSLKGTIAQVTAGCKYRAKRRGLDCDIDVAYITELFDCQDGRCARTGVKLLPSNAKGTKGKHPDTFSVDRVDTNAGYTQDNIMLVSTIYNTAKSMWTHEDVVEFAKRLLEYEQN